MYGLDNKAWAALARRPRLYHAAMRIGITALSALAFGRGKFRCATIARRSWLHPIDSVRGNWSR